MGLGNRENRNKSEASRQTLFSEEERGGFLKNAETPPQIYDVKPAKNDPALQGGKKFSINLQNSKVVTPDGVARQARFAMDRRTRTTLYLALAVVLAFIVVIVLPSNVFDVNNTKLSLAWFINVTQRNVSNIVSFISFQGAYGGIDFKIFRYIIVGLAGAALALSGAAYQGSLKNQLASPSTLGVMSGAQLGTIVFILLSPVLPIFAYSSTGTTVTEINESLFADMNPIQYIWANAQTAICSLVGSLLVVGCVLGIARLAGHGRTSRVAMVISGQVFAACISSFIVLVRMYLETYGTEYQINALSYTVTGGFDATFTFLHLCMVGIPVIICMVIVLLMRNKLNLLAFGEEEAQSMGISVRKTRIALVACCTIITAVVVAFCGPVGYVGFLVPHIARRIIGPDFKYLLPAAALLGALFMLIVYYLFTCFTIPTGSISTVTTTVGVVLFVIMLFRQRRSGYASW